MYVLLCHLPISAAMPCAHLSSELARHLILRCVCCQIWEANSQATAYTMHPCGDAGKNPSVCYYDKALEAFDVHGEHGVADVAPTQQPRCEEGHGFCDKPGCDFQTYRMGLKNFYGKGSQFTIDSSKPVEIVTQFLTADGTDDGELVEVRRFYVQDGKRIENPAWNGHDSLTDTFCHQVLDYFEDPKPTPYKTKGALKNMGEVCGGVG